MKSYKTPLDYVNEFTERFNEYSDLEIVKCFNREVGIIAWGTARQGFLYALKNQIIKRGIDFSEVGDNISMSYKYCVTFINRKLKRIDGLSEVELKPLIQEYLKNVYPEKGNSNITFVDYNNDNTIIVLNNTMEVMSIKSNDIIKKNKDLSN